VKGYAYMQRNIGLRWVLEQSEPGFDNARHHWIERYWPSIKGGRAVIMMNSYPVGSKGTGCEPVAWPIDQINRETVGMVAALPGTSERWLGLIAEEVGAMQVMRWVAKMQKPKGV
jgi:hypothetical protein